MFDELMRLSWQSFNRGLYDVSYHTLAAALHLVVHGNPGDLYGKEKPNPSFSEIERCLEEIENSASLQIDIINLKEPGYQHSTPSARERGTQSIFSQIAHQAHLRRSLSTLKNGPRH